MSARKIETSREGIKHSPRSGRFIAETSGIRGADLLRRRIYYDGEEGRGCDDAWKNRRLFVRH